MKWICDNFLEYNFFTLLIVPEGIEILKGHRIQHFQHSSFNRTRRNWNQIRRFLKLIHWYSFNRTRRNWNYCQMFHRQRFHRTFNRTRRNWNFHVVFKCIVVVVLLIVPEGIEIFFAAFFKKSDTQLLIVPEGIEISFPCE